MFDKLMSCFDDQNWKDLQGSLFFCSEVYIAKKTQTAGLWRALFRNFRR